MSEIDRAMSRESRELAFIYSMEGATGGEVYRSLKLPNQTVFRDMHNLERKGKLISSNGRKNRHEKVYRLTNIGSGQVEEFLASLRNADSLLAHYRKLRTDAYKKNQ